MKRNTNPNGRYFDQAEGLLHERFFSADGFDNDGYGVNGGEGFYANGDQFYADGRPANGMVRRSPTSLPFILNVENTSTVDVTGVILLDANKALFGASNFNNPASIEITLGNEGISYTQFLEYVKSNPVRVAEIYLQSANNAQIFKSLIVAQRKITGGQDSNSVIPVISPFQQQNGVTIVNYQFPIDGNTYIQTTILKQTVLSMLLYPSTDMQLARALNGSSIERELGNPKIGKAGVVTLAPSAEMLQLGAR